MAGLSEQSARTSETAAKQAQAGAEAAEDASRQHAEAAEEDRMEVSEARKAVEQAVANIVADRELIQQNAKDLADVKNELTEKADVIVESANGNGYCMPDSADEPLRSLRILGKSTQNGDPSPESPVPIVNAGGKGNIGIKIEGKNLIPESEIRLDPFLKRAFLKGYLLKAGVTYTLSTKGIVSGIYFNNVGETEKIAYAYEAKSVTYTPNVDILTTLRVWDDGSHMSDLKDYYIQLEVGDTATGYEPYKTPQNLTVQTPNGLLGSRLSLAVITQIMMDGGGYVMRLTMAKAFIFVASAKPWWMGRILNSRHRPMKTTGICHRKVRLALYRAELFRHFLKLEFSPQT